MQKSVAPARERGLKFRRICSVHLPQRRSRKGAWIEMQAPDITLRDIQVAPARERGLKCRNSGRAHGLERRRSRKGAWIEIAAYSHTACTGGVAPARERGLK